jgi:hypothetical protein
MNLLSLIMFKTNQPKETMKIITTNRFKAIRNNYYSWKLK